MKHSAPRSTEPRIRLVGPAGRGLARDGGVERYHRWLASAWADRLADDGVPFALKARLGGEVVRTGDGVSAAWVEATGRSRVRWARHVRRERAAVRAARSVVAISPMVAAEIARHYGRSGGVHVVLNPVMSRPATPERRAAGGVLFVGHGFRRKGLDHWLAAIERLGLAGHVVGADRRLARWRRHAPAGVHFHGAVDAAPWIAGAAVLVHPARYEPYGNVVAEAVAAGTPVVASDACGAACLLHPAHVWSPTEGIEALVARIRGALDAPRPVSRRPPGRDEHLAALSAAVFDS